MNMKIFYKLSLAVALLAVLVGCGGAKRCYIEAGEVTPVEVARFDSVIPRYVACDDTMEQHKIIRETGRFWGIYNFHLLQLFDMPYFKEGLAAFMQDTIVSQLYADAQREYEDMSDVEQQLAIVAARYNKLFPDKPVPVFQSHISVLRLPIITVDSLVSISIDTYLGDSYPMYSSRYNNYELVYRNRNRIVVDVAEVLLRNAISHPHGKTLLDDMIYEGRILYLLSGLLDDDSPMTLMTYNDEQVAWCVENEDLIWKKIVEQGDLFSTDDMIKNKYLNPAPFTATLTQDAPARVGRWVGLRIVQQYIDKYNISPLQLATDSIYHVEILRLSGYNYR